MVERLLQCNYYGTLNATRSFLPLVRDGGRLVNMSSLVGELNKKYSESIRSAFASSKTVDDVNKLMESFTSAVREGRHIEKGWPRRAYVVSKSGVTGMTRAIALEHKQQGGKVLVNSCCPDYVGMNMDKHQRREMMEKGLQTPTLLALGDIGGSCGELWLNEDVIEW